MKNHPGSVYELSVTAILLAVGLVLPFLTGQIQAIARVISPLHIPALICGLCCGWQWGLALGIVLPLLRGLLFGIPVFPTAALPMAFELAAYGFVTGFIYPRMICLFKKENHLAAILVSMLAAMIIGRLVGGAAKAALLAFGLIGANAPFTFAAFFSSYYVATAPGALIHLILIPEIVIALEKAGLTPLSRRN